MNETISKFESKCSEWSNRFHPNGVKVVFNKRLTNQESKKIKYIIVGDNPGKEEEAQKEYFVGDAGIVTRLFFERFLVENFDDEVLALNKTPISTATTNSLKELDNNILMETQEFMADLVLELQNQLKVPVIISGFAGCRKASKSSVKWIDLNSSKKSATGKYFFHRMKENYKDSQLAEKLFILKHFSRNCFFEDFKIENYRRSDRLDIFRIGNEYKEELFKNDA